VKTWTRREVLALGATGLLAGCSPFRGSDGTPSPTRSPHTSAPGAADWSRLGATVDGRLSLPGSRTYKVARLVQNPRFDDNRPLAVLSVGSTSDVSKAISFAQDHDVPIALRSGGHSYPGYSAGGAPGTDSPRSFVIDCRGLDSVDLADDGSTTVGAGASLATVYEAIGRKGRAIAGGSCATVGIAGLSQGGGVGVLVRSQGLTCDSVTAMQVVTADGSAHTVTANDDPDLFWALRGGGGGHLGVVTAMTFKTFAAPTINSFYLSWPIAVAAEVIEAWQSWAPGADDRLWSTLKLLGGQKHPGGPIILVSGTWIGPRGALDDRLADLLRHCPPPSSRTSSTRDYLAAMMAYAGCSSLPVARCNTDAGGGLERESFAATSHVAYVPLASGGIDDLLNRVHGARAPGLKEAGISMDALGGVVRDVDSAATAFVHREALMTVQYTATFTDEADASHADDYVRGFRTTMTPHWGGHAYVNYADKAVDNYRTAYFGTNAVRLAQVKRAYDPQGFFAQPQGF
jgi:FAD/FMN-containing dehydrogenase